MVYKKYIKRDGRVFGPYYYESYRENGKVKTRFISGPTKNDMREKKNSKNKYLITTGIILLILLTAVAINYDNIKEFWKTKKIEGFTIKDIFKKFSSKGVLILFNISNDLILSITFFQIISNWEQHAYSKS